MSSHLSKNVVLLLKTLAELPRDSIGRAYISGQELQKKTGLSPSAINDAIEILEESRFVKCERALGSAPYNFTGVQITPRGRLNLESL